MNTAAEAWSGWVNFWDENNRCLYGEAAAAAMRRDPAAADALPVRPAISTLKPRVPVLVELGEDWIIDQQQVNYRRYIQDFDFQQATRALATRALLEDIGFYLKPKVDSSSLLHGSIYGHKIEYPPDSTPWLEHLVHSADEIPALIRRIEALDPAQAGLVPWFVDKYRQLNRPYRWRILHDPTSVHGPGTILSFFFGINDLCLYLYSDPDLIQALLAAVGDMTVSYSRAMRQLTGAAPAGVGIFDDVAGLISPRHFRKFFMPVYQRIYSELAPSPDDDRFYHNDAKVGHILAELHELGVNGINPDPQTPAALIREKLPQAVLYGCIPPLVLKDGTPAEVMEAARASIVAGGQDGALVLTTAGSMNMGTPLANLLALCQAAERYGRYENGRLIDERKN